MQQEQRAAAMRQQTGLMPNMANYHNMLRMQQQQGGMNPNELRQRVTQNGLRNMYVVPAMPALII